MKPNITAVMPAYNATSLLPIVLPPLLAMRRAGEIADVLVVDDCSTDETIAMARDMGASVLKTERNGGPGAARNLAAKHIDTDIMWLVDADVVAAPGGPATIARVMANPDVHAMFGCYDDAPAGQSTLSRYRNLIHRYHHQKAAGDVSSFWAGCGAVRLDAFHAVGGFDTETYRVPSIEDIELGYRLTDRGGRIVVDPTLEAKHLKVWDAIGTLHTDIFRRGLPWARLMMSRGGIEDTLNTGQGERLRAVLAVVALLSLLGSIAVPGLFALTVFLVFAILAANYQVLEFMSDIGGVWFGLKAVALHQIYYLYASATLMWVLFEHHILGRRNRLHVP